MRSRACCRPGRYPTINLTPGISDHRIWHTMFNVAQLPQMASNQHLAPHR
jgi:hypothetical protein